jgi:hypothetical protein
MAELVVPRSIPIVLPMKFPASCDYVEYRSNTGGIQQHEPTHIK